MKMDKTVSDLLAVLKDANRDKVITDLNKINENGYNGNISHVFLKEYFRSDTHVSSRIYYREALSIVEIFPQYSVPYIKTLLKALGNEDNRIIVILRLLLKNESEGDKKRILPQRFGAISQVAASSSDDEIEDDDTLKEKSATKLSIATSKSTSTAKNSFTDKPGTSRETARQQNLPTSDKEPPKKKPKLIQPGAVNSCGTASENVAIQKEMKMDKTVSDLLAVLKDVNRDEIITQLNEINENGCSGNISHVFLKEHFRSDTKVSSVVYYKEVLSIVDIFPQYSVKYIKSLLKAFGNDDNRISVIVRLLLKNESKGNKKKILPQRFGEISQVAASSSDDEIEDDDTLKEKSATKLSIATFKSTLVPQKSSTAVVNDARSVTKNPAPADNRNQIDEAPPLYAFKLFRKMIEAFRNASSEYIKQLCEGSNMSQFYIEECLTTYVAAQIKQYTTEFNVRNFLSLIPDPETYFNDPNKPSSVLVNGKVDKSSLHYAISFLGNRYPLVRHTAIKKILKKRQYCLIPTVKELDETKDFLEEERESIPLDTIPVQNIPLVREVAYLTYKHYILAVRDNSESEEEQTDNVS